MELAGIGSLMRLKGIGKVAELTHVHEERSTFKLVGWASLAVGIAALGLFIGRELRLRYKFNHRSPYEFFSHAGDEMPVADYGMGI